MFRTPLNTPADFHSLWGWLDFTQTCLARRKIFLTGGLTSPISRAATAHSEWTSPHKLAAGGKLERTGGRAPRHLWRWYLWQTTSKNQLWTWQAASATDFKSSAHFYQDFMVYLEVIFFLFFLQHQEFDLTAHLNTDTVTLAGLFLMLIYMGLAFSWVSDVIPHGSRWY